MPVDFSVRAVITGMLTGALLSICNIYSGLKIGWSSNMSITGALLAYAAWQLRPARAREGSPFSILETNLSQTAASSAAAVSSAGLVAGIPALSLLTGVVLPWPKLAAWVFGVCVVGNVVAIPIRRQMLINDPLPFPFGIATGEMLKQMYARGADAMERVRAMLIAAAVAGVCKPLEHLRVLKSVALPGSILGVSLKNLTWSLDPSLLLVAVGGLMGVRACASLMAGAALAYGGLAPWLVTSGLVQRGAPGGVWFKELVGWLLWPGVTLMVVSSLASFALSWRSIGQAFRGLSGVGAEPDDISPRWFSGLFTVALVFSVALQVGLFGIPVGIAVIGVLLSFALAIVGARVQGETGVTPVGAMGKVTQLIVGAAIPGDVAANLMTANVTGGSASQCGDLMNDFKTGQMLGSTPKSQFVSQLCGALSGSLFGSAVYLLLIHDPHAQLFTTEWAAPAVATWKAVAVVFKVGLSALPAKTGPAIAVAAALGIVMAVAEARSRAKYKKWIPSPSAFGLGFVVPANQSLSMFLGGVIAYLVLRRYEAWHKRLWIVVCAGAIAGESLVGVALSLLQIAGK